MGLLNGPMQDSETIRGGGPNVDVMLYTFWEGGPVRKVSTVFNSLRVVTPDPRSLEMFTYRNT